MNPGTSTRLAQQLNDQRTPVCTKVASRLLREFPELTTTLRLEESYNAETRISQVAVERLSELVRAILVFDLPSLADKEFGWAQGVLPRSGVTYLHQSTMVRMFFEEVRRLNLSPPETLLSQDLERYLLSVVKTIYNKNSA
jgi:hypothetical protein